MYRWTVRWCTLRISAASLTVSHSSLVVVRFGIPRTVDRYGIHTQGRHSDLADCVAYVVACQVMTTAISGAGSTAVPTFNELVGERVHRLMWRYKIQQIELAPKIGITQSALSRKLRGVRAFGVDELMTVAELLDVEVADLLPTKVYDDGPDPTDPGQSSRPRESNPRPFHMIYILTREDSPPTNDNDVAGLHTDIPGDEVFSGKTPSLSSVTMRRCPA